MAITNEPARPRSAGTKSRDLSRDPERTKARLLAAARTEFSEKGLSGARVNAIADAAGVNKQLLYYYFGNKEELYVEVLERAYADIRVGEQELALDALPPREAMRHFVEFTFDYLVENRYFVALLNDENIHKARHIAQSSQIRGLHKRLRKTIGQTLERGYAEGVFKRQVDPVDFYISMASLCYFFHSNNYTLSAIFDRDLSTDEQMRHRRSHIIELAMGFLDSEKR